MKNIILFCTHVGGEQLFHTLSEHPTISGYQTDIIYNHPEDLLNLVSNIHKNKNAASLWMDLILHNYKLNSVCSYCKLVFFFGDPQKSIEEICKIYPEDYALRYYELRLRGMLEYAVKYPCLVLENNTHGLGFNIPETNFSYSPISSKLGSHCRLYYEKFVRKFLKELQHSSNRIVSLNSSFEENII